MMKNPYCLDSYKSDFPIVNNYHTLIKRVDNIGYFTREVIETIWVKKNVEIRRFVKKCIDLTDKYATYEIENAARRAYYYKNFNYETLCVILEERLYRFPLSPNTDIYGQCLLDFK